MGVGEKREKMANDDGLEDMTNATCTSSFVDYG